MKPVISLAALVRCFCAIALNPLLASIASTSALLSAVPRMSSNFGSSGVLGFGTELSTASLIAGSQRNLPDASESVSAEPVTAALPSPRAKSVCTFDDVNHSRNCLAASGFLAPEAMPQMKVPIAGPLFSCAGVAAMSILPVTCEELASSTRCTRPVYSVRAMHLPWRRTWTSWSVSNSATPDGMYSMNDISRSSAPTPSGPREAGRPVVVDEAATVRVQQRQVGHHDRVALDPARRPAVELRRLGLRLGGVGDVVPGLGRPVEVVVVVVEELDVVDDHERVQG